MDKTVPQGRVKGTLTPPCSKSYAQRALAAALLTEGESCLRNLEYCDDTHCSVRPGAASKRSAPPSAARTEGR